MTHALNVVAESRDVSTGIADRTAIADALAEALADTYRLTFKTHAYHWNVEGPLFYSVHNLTEAQYEDLFKAADELAERIRAIGKMAPSAMSEIMKSSVIEDRTDQITAGEMVSDLADDHEKVAKRLHDLIALAAEHDDPVTEDLATARSAFHEKAAWMLRALVAQ